MLIAHADLHQLDAVIDHAHLMAEIQHSQLEGSLLRWREVVVVIILKLTAAKLVIISIRLQVLLQLLYDKPIYAQRRVLERDGVVVYVIGSRHISDAGVVPIVVLLSRVAVLRGGSDGVYLSVDFYIPTRQAALQVRRLWQDVSKSRFNHDLGLWWGGKWRQRCRRLVMGARSVIGYM